MFRNIVMLIATVTILGISVGCGGPGDATTVKQEDRPAGLRQSDGTKQGNLSSQGNELPEGLYEY